MSDGFKISGPGFYRQRDGGKAEVLGIRGNKAYGIDGNDDGQDWKLSGCYHLDHHQTNYDLVAPWTDPPEPIPAGVWWNEAEQRFCLPNTRLPTPYPPFYNKWHARRAEFPQGPPTPPATPWTQVDVPWPLPLFQLHGRDGLFAPAKVCHGEIIFTSIAGRMHEVNYLSLAELDKWTIDGGKTLRPCTREAVAAWRQSNGK